MRSPNLRACLALALVLAPAGIGCSSPQETPRSSCGELAGSGTPLEGALEIGDYVQPEFERLVDGDGMELEQGTQGGWMVLPALRVDAAALGTDGRCLTLSLGAETGIAAPAQFQMQLPDAEPGEPYWYFGPLLLLLGFELADVNGRDATITAIFQDDGVFTRDEVVVSLTNEH